MSDETLHGPIRMWLTVFAGSVATEVQEISRPRFVIGREEGCDLVLDDPKVSREHAEIVGSNGPFRVLRDLGSANGTLVNGRPLHPPAGFTAGSAGETELSGGEWLIFGDTLTRITLVDPRQVTEPGPPGGGAPSQVE
jgi:pSer/pThr/pTyr-binding forkhead associated (FHA) protein